MPVFNNILAGAAGSAGGAAEFKIERSLRFNPGDSAYLSRTPSSAGNRRTFTWSGWVKRSGAGTYHTFFSAAESGTSNPRAGLAFDNNDALRIEFNPTGSAWLTLISDAVFRDPSAWYHVVVAVDTTQATSSDRTKLYVNGVQQTLTGSYVAQNETLSINNTWAHSIGRFQATPSNYVDGYLAEVYFIDGQTPGTSTDDDDGSVTGIPDAEYLTDFGEFDADTGVWNPIEYTGTYGTNGFHLDFSDNSSNAALGYDAAGSNDWTVNNITTGTAYSTNLTPSSTAYPNTTLSNGGLTWTGSTSNDTGTVSSLTIPTNKKTYVEVTHTSTGGGDPGPGVAQGPTTELGLDSVKAWWRGGTNGGISVSTLGSFTGTDTSWSNGDVLGIALDNTANSGGGSITFYKNGTQIHTGGSGWTSYTDLRFEWQNNGSGTSSGTWNYGASTFSYPVPGHTGLFEEAGTGDDSLFDSPTNYDDGTNIGGNYATLNAVSNYGLTLSNGNLDWNGGTTQRYARPTIFVDSGKWYCEFTMRSTSHVPGIIGSEHPDGAGTLGEGASSRFQNNGTVGYSGLDPVTGGLTWAVGDIVQLYMDMDNKAIYWGVNGTLKAGNDGNTGVPTSGASKTGAVLYTGMPGFTDRIGSGFWGPCAGTYGTDTSVNSSVNFGATPFAFTPPTGYKSLCTQNLDEPLIAKGSDYFDTKTYDGNGGTQTISGLGFSPDLVWLKRRNAAVDHLLFDSLRGFGANKELVSNDTYTEGATGVGNPNTDVWGYVDSVTSDGFVVEKGSDSNGSVANTTGGTYAAWVWDAGNAANPTSISVGSLNSSVYDSSKTWSNGWDSNLNSSYPGTRSFDGDISTGGVVNVNATATWTVPDSGYAISSSLRVYGRLEHADGGFTITFSDSSTSTIPVNATKQWHTISGAAGKTLTSIAVSKASNGYEGIFHAVEIDGKILLDYGVTPVDNFPSIASTCRTSQDAGFSCLTYSGNGTSGSTVAHNLGKKPDFIIAKARNRADNWVVYHSSLGASYHSDLNLTGQFNSGGSKWTTTEPTSSVFSITSDFAINGSFNYSALCWCAVEGYSAMGSYTGSTSFPFVYCGFRPAFIILKKYDGGDKWCMYDTARGTYNTLETQLHPSEPDGESAAAFNFDILSNGFRPMDSSGQVNENGKNYIFFAVAENPFKYARAR